MNRLVIIGNGFDLAHGLPTSYKDFIDDYIVEKVNIFLTDRVYEDKLISIKSNNSYPFKEKPNLNSIIEVNNWLKRYADYVRMSYKSLFLKRLQNKFDKINWVDIESEYFDSLLELRYGNGEFEYKRVNDLNDEFDYLRALLEKYLKKVETEKSFITKSEYQNQFCGLIKKEDVVLKKMETDVEPKELLFLNFNYTNTLDSYFQKCSRRITTNLNYIHGELNNSYNPLIFGFGDEFNIHYKNFEEEKNNILFRHIKSFGYFNTQNYHNLIRFLDSDDFQVYIFGHSCGLSDRTMLKEIFENERCISIKIFYYQREDGTNDFIEKTMEISRHFENKGLMRKKIVPFPMSKKM
ncbi:AbiH family protein [Flavobacterium sp. NG2]|uniref:AbiH family protein n=1 Tax=Flavobacterium sp. NG2 TaxID=3097547 RepID=UPI002A81CA20|nr:AbiH family protein [Flavobacterium sp. NG2]WPR71854.1 AbiH family protein [Flavobacterium sp. NG2]